MKIQLLPSSINQSLRASAAQHLTCFVIDDRVAIDAGSLAFGVTDAQRQTVRDVILTHAHLDHIAGLPVFIDDLFAALREPLRVHATAEVVQLLETHIFNWQIYPRFSELQNDYGSVLEYYQFKAGEQFAAAHLGMTAVAVNHLVPTVGFIVSDGKRTVAFSSDTAESPEFWAAVNKIPQLDALFLECSFPNDHAQLAAVSHHLTPLGFFSELKQLRSKTKQIFAVNLKPVFREIVAAELQELDISNLQIAEPGREYTI